MSHELVEQRIVEQGARRLQGAVTGWAALRWQGAAYFDGSARDRSNLPIPLISLAKLRADDRIVVSREQLALAERIQVAGLWCASPERAVFDEVRRRGTMRAGVAAIDMAAAAGLTTVEAVRHHIYMAGPKTGIDLARRAVALAIDSSGSPPETLMRLVWELDAELPRPLCNVPLFSRGGTLLGFPDLFDPVPALWASTTDPRTCLPPTGARTSPARNGFAITGWSTSRSSRVTSATERPSYDGCCGRETELSSSPRRSAPGPWRRLFGGRWPRHRFGVVRCKFAVAGPRSRQIWPGLPPAAEVSMSEFSG